MVVYHFLVQELFGARKFQKFDPEAVAATMAGIWLNGMQNGTEHANGSGNGPNGYRLERRNGHRLEKR
jgi:hypothetical protein